MTTGATSGSSSDPSPARRKGWPKGKKRRLLPKDANAPKTPTSGYMLFMIDQRELMKQSQSRAGFLEVTKLVANKWAQLDATEKQKYLETAEQDKERFQREFAEYKKTDTYKEFISQQEKAETKRLKKEKKDLLEAEIKVPPPQLQVVTSKNTNSKEIPIFTEDFLNHNKGREAELRQLRKSNTDYEEQNAILQKHIESMRSAVNKLETETKQQESNNTALKEHLLSLRRSLTQAFASLPIPGTNDTPSEETIDNYVTRLHTILTANPQQHNKLIQNVKTIVNNIHTN